MTLNNRSKRFQVRVKGELACFTRPELKVERVSYEVMTPSAARGVLEAILWKPAIAWEIHAITVGAPIQWTSFRRNEVNGRVSERASELFIEDERAQRNTVALKNVDYLVDATFTMTPRAGGSDNLRKFEEMFERRVRKGQHHHMPALGCREFDAHVSFDVNDFRPVDQADRPLGRVFFDFDWKSLSDRPEEAPGDFDAQRPLFFDARLSAGVMHVPLRSEVLAMHRRES